jgi:hypothetical protein
MTCVAFKALVAAHLPDNSYRITAPQAVKLQESASNWCPVTEIGIHNLMALPGLFEPQKVNVVHCYLGLQDEKSMFLKSALKRSTGEVPSIADAKSYRAISLSHCCRCSAGGH